MLWPCSFVLLEIIPCLFKNADPWVLPEKLQGAASNVNWAMDENPDSLDPIMITLGADHLVQKASADGVLRWYDEWADIFESAANDADIIACRTEGPYQGRTVMAVVRDIRMTAYPRSDQRWIIHICKSALIEQPYQNGVLQATADLLNPDSNLIVFAPQIYERLMTAPWTGPYYIDYFRWLEFYLLDALLNIRQVEDSPQSSSSPSTAIIGTTNWQTCCRQKIETIGGRFMTLLFYHSFQS